MVSIVNFGFLTHFAARPISLLGHPSSLLTAAGKEQVAAIWI
jgi:hypothetical protein